MGQVNMGAGVWRATRLGGVQLQEAMGTRERGLSLSDGPTDVTRWQEQASAVYPCIPVKFLSRLTVCVSSVQIRRIAT